jgi:predicted ATPase
VAIEEIVHNVKVYRVSIIAKFELRSTSPFLKRNCQELSRQCAELIIAMTENTDGLEGTITQQAADQVEV